MNARTTFPAYDTHRRRAIQMRAVAVGVAARWPARQPVEGVVGEALGVAGARDGVAAHDGATGASGALRGAGPTQPVVLVIAERLRIRPGLQLQRLVLSHPLCAS